MREELQQEDLVEKGREEGAKTGNTGETVKFNVHLRGHMEI